MTKKKASEDFKRGYQRVMSSRTDAFEIKKSDKTKLKEKEIIDQYREARALRDKTGPAPLTPIQEKFVNIYCSRYGEKSATQCAIDAGFGEKGAHTRASELLNPNKSPNVVLEIQSRLAMLRDQWDIDRDKHLAMLTKIRDEARIKGQYGVVAKCEELRGKVGGLYLEKSMVLTKDIKDENSADQIKDLYATRADFEKAMLIMAEDMFPKEKSELYDDVEIELSEKEKQNIKFSDELEKYQQERNKARNKFMKKND